MTSFLPGKSLLCLVHLVDTQDTKSYLALTGDADFCRILGQELIGAGLYDDSFFAAQTAGGALAFRVMADLVAQMPTRPTVWLQAPTYGNYIPILSAAGARFKSVPYYDRLRCVILFDQMLDGLKEAQPGDIFLMQGACHNPTGADPGPT
jgi:aspartate/tyrosine/aromatic aminotransferase